MKRSINLFIAVLMGSLALGACATQSKPTHTGRSPKSLETMKDNLLRFEYAPGELTQLCEDSMNNAKLALDEIAAIPPSQRTIANTLLAFERATAEVNDVAGPLTFMGYVSTDQKIHDEGQACEEKLGPFFVELSTRKDLYDAIKDATPRNENEKRLLSETLRDFEQQGLKLPAEKLAEMKKLKQELSVIESQFQAALNNDVSSVELTEAELDGVSEDFKSRLKRSAAGNFVVTTKNPDYMHIRENAKNSEARKKVQLAYYNKGGEKNVQLLEQAVVLRQKISKLIGLKSWADYRTWGRMAKNGDTALKFLNGLKAKLALRAKQDQAKLLKFKKSLDPSATDLKAWDLDYLAYQLKKRDYDLDSEKVKEYFPADRVVAGVFEIYSKLLGVKFVPMEGAKAWADGVQIFKIVDAKDGTERATFYADLYPRPLKYGHFAAFSLVMTHQNEDGSFQKPISAMVGNFDPPANGKPSLMKHTEVETYFHEFGHIMHQTLTRAPYASLSGTSTARDFVEAPSQLMENWAWSPKILEGLSGHYLNPKEKLPKQLIKKMLAAKDFNQGNMYTRQLMLGLLDMTYHTSTGPVDSTAIYAQIHKEIVGIEALEGAHFQGSFGHLMNGYDAGYYGYLWSEVYADDLFTRFGKRGLLARDHLLDPKVGMAYRRSILEKGRMLDADVVMKEFLGREPSSEAFFKRLGI